MKRWTVWLAALALAATVAAGCDHDNGGGESKLTQKGELYRCQSCDDALAWLRENATLQMERELEAMYGEGGAGDDDAGWLDDDVPGDDAGGDDAADDDFADDDSGAPSDDDEQADDDDYTGTNVQETGVDEPDMVKTDGAYLYLVTGGYFLIFDAKPEAATHEAGRVDVEGAVRDMFLYENTEVVFSLLTRDIVPVDVWPELSRDQLYYDVTKITVIDSTDKAAPRVIREVYAEGDMVGGRLVGRAARLVLSSAKAGPALDTYIDGYWEMTPEQQTQALAELEAHDQALIEAADLEAWLPRLFSVTHEAGGDEVENGLLTDCLNIYHPKDPMGTATLSVLTILMDDPTARQTDIGLIADGYVVYASAGNLYVAGSLDASWEWAPDRTEFVDQSPIHRFDIASDPAEAIYVGTGFVRGWLSSPFNMSEWEGHLRIATTYGGWREGAPQRNGVYVLALNEEGMTQVGALEDIALDESIYAARLIGARGYLVTYQQTDPLFTVDLSDPERPQLAGQLRVPGYSTYLHPMDDDHLLAIGLGGDDWGAGGNLVVSMFDVSDFANPQRLWLYDFGYAWSEATYNNHAFLYDDSRHLLAVPLTANAVTDDDAADDDQTGSGDGKDEPFAGFVALSATIDAGFVELARINHYGIEPAAGSDDYWGLPQPRRSVRIGEYLFTISDVGLVVTYLGNWEDARTISLPWENDPGASDGGDSPPDLL
jgi:hypothetical protein